MVITGVCLFKYKRFDLATMEEIKSMIINVVIMDTKENDIFIERLCNT